MITREQLQAMSDTQILRKLYELLGFEVHEYVFEEVITIQEENKVTTAEMRPNDIMPLAFEYGVYYYNGTACTAICDFIDGHVVFDEPFYFDAGRQLRAIACCLILVLQENGK